MQIVKFCFLVFHIHVVSSTIDDCDLQYNLIYNFLPPSTALADLGVVLVKQKSFPFVGLCLLFHSSSVIETLLFRDRLVWTVGLHQP